ncbi:hypothetical protein HYH03_008579 [Edaphochlamys debaryana]|uniref:SGNH hydrolase-type esterase domain-containing protein n=1 Tax=Edaphochlamys debaryana TaxID=47281 RepID=A0A835XZM2_9CHLO|nr:hypothetical protein HYH03_008579 [Edaphochlamys debaryana]|eukprot:KAG2493156.1 hypothetical protein HYH03_008579 [Edaphochlamys debaryana]
MRLIQLLLAVAALGLRQALATPTRSTLADGDPEFASAESGSGTGTSDPLHRLLAAARQYRKKHAASQMLQPKHISRALYHGDSERIRNFVRRMAEGDSLTVALVGGSVSHGMGATGGTPPFGGWLAGWLSEVAPPARPHPPPPPDGLLGLTAAAGSGATTGFVLIPPPGGAPQSCVRVVNAACPATPSTYMNLCLGEYLREPGAVDLVLVEYTVNDAPLPVPYMENESRKSLELLLRKLLGLPRRPAVVLLNSYRWFSEYPLPSGRSSDGTYYNNPEGEFFEFATYYGLPLISVKAAAYHQMKAGLKGFRVDGLAAALRADPSAPQDQHFFDDPMHPSGNTGHKAMAELIIGLLIHTARGLVAQPWRPAEEAALSEPLPTHMVAGNADTRHDRCLLGPRLKAAAVEKQGFDWVNEGTNPLAPKWGFTAYKAGSSITLDFLSSASASANTSATTAPAALAASAGGSGGGAAAPLSSPGGPKLVMLLLAYLRSYEHMGVAEVTCEGGCLCGEAARTAYNQTVEAAARNETYSPSKDLAAAAGPAHTFDGHWDSPTSQLQLTCFPVLLTPECRVRVTVAKETKSGQHKVKIGGLIVVEAAPDAAKNMCMYNLEAAERAAGFRER